MESMKLKSAFETEVFISEAGYITVKQSDEAVSLTSSQAYRVAEMLTRLADLASEWEQNEIIEAD